jgi:hypothetical protein
VKFSRAYVAKQSDRARVAETTGLSDRVIICGEDAGNHISAPKWSVRDGETWFVLDVRDFGDTHKAIADGIAVFHKRGAAVFEHVTGLLSGTGEAAKMLSSALSRQHGDERNMRERAKDMQAASAAKRRGERKSPEEARLIWGDLSLTDAECAKQTGWPISSAKAHPGIALGGRRKLAAQIAADSKALRAIKRKTKR